MTSDPLDKIEDIRTANNILWMQILRIALQSAPKETKAILSTIREFDHKIVEQVGKIIDD